MNTVKLARYIVKERTDAQSLGSSLGWAKALELRASASLYDEPQKCRRGFPRQRLILAIIGLTYLPLEGSRAAEA